MKDVRVGSYTHEHVHVYENENMHMDHQKPVCLWCALDGRNTLKAKPDDTRTTFETHFGVFNSVV